MKALLVSFALLTAISGFAQWGTKVDGNGQLKKESREVGSFTSLSSSGAWNVDISYGDSHSLQIEADENLLQYIETSVENGKLQIRTKKGYQLRSQDKIMVHVSMKKVEKIMLSGSGNITGNGKFNSDGDGSFDVSGSGNIKINFDRFNSLAVHISGSGDVKLGGNSGSVETHISGSGNIDCSELVCDNVTASISGSGNMKITANKMINANISGSGNIYYKGDASDVRSHTAGSGRVRKG